MVELLHEDNSRPVTTLFSGDLGRPSQLIIKDPSVVEQADYLFLESTYGSRDHKNERESLDELAEALAYSYGKGEKVIIPAFAVERTQEMIYCLHLLAREGRLPADMPIYIDSPWPFRRPKSFGNTWIISTRTPKPSSRRGTIP
jgi:metallo-beta-lactamase family protein